MGQIYFNIEGDIEDVVLTIFNSLEVINVNEGDSVNCLKGIYFSYKVFGLTLKLEYNSFDYEDQFKYVLFVRENFLSNLAIDDEIVQIGTELVWKVLVKNLKSEIAMERNGSLEILNKDRND